MKTFIAILLNGDQLPHAKADNLTGILNIIFVIVGAFAFLMVVIGGFRYTIAGGNADSVASARRQIIYSIVGLIVIGLAASIVNFALGRL